MKRLLIVLALIVSSMAVIYAQDDDSRFINDPAVNDDANACFEGGTLEGKCDSDLMWTAGWYLIRFEAGIYSRANIPFWLEWVLPSIAPPAPDIPVVVDTCYTNGTLAVRIETSQLNTTAAPAFWTGTACESGPVVNAPITPNAGGTAIITSTDAGTALTQCQALITGAGGYAVENLAGLGFNTPANWYLCGTDL